MSNEVIIYEPQRADIVAKGNNYTLAIGDKPSIKLVREVDFGVIRKKDGTPITDRPTLFKSGAEKILMLYGIPFDLVLMDSHKDHEKGYFYYEVKAIAYFPDGRVFRAGVGCANTNEKSNGFNTTPYDTANSMLKKAKKRAVVDLALSIANASDMFTQDIEDTKFMENAKAFTEVNNTDAFITPKQTQRIFAIAGQNGFTKESARQTLIAGGFESTKTIKQKDYDAVCALFEKEK